MKKLIIYLGKRYVIGAIRDAVRAKASDVAKWAARIRGWIAKMQKVIAYFDSVAARLEDGELTELEASDSITEAETLAKEITV